MTPKAPDLIFESMTSLGTPFRIYLSLKNAPKTIEMMENNKSFMLKANNLAKIL